MSIRCWQRITRYGAGNPARLVAATLLFYGTVGAQPPLPSVDHLIARYDAAMSDPGAPPLDRFEVEGTITGAALDGAFHSWQDGSLERADQNLGLRSERTIRNGDRYFFVSSTGNVQEYHGSMLRRSRTSEIVEGGDLSRVPGCCRVAGVASIGGRQVYELVVNAPGGDSQSLFLDAQTALPVRLAYEEDDGITTIDFTDWRTIDGHRFAFKSVSSDGNHAFDTTQTTTAVTMDVTLDPSIFIVPPNRQIEMTGVKHVDLVEEDGHLFAPVSIAGHTYNFLIDTGAQSILLDSSVARGLGLHEEGALEASGATRTGGLHLTKVDELDIAGAAIRDLVVTTLDLGASTQGAFHIDGILGYPFFASADVRIDFGHDAMDFGPPGSLNALGEQVDADFDRQLVELPAVVNGITAPFMLDTGDAAELLLYGPFVQKHADVVPTTLDNGRSYGLGGAADSYRSTVDRFDFASTTLYNVTTDVMLATQGAFADRLDAGNIGLGVLHNFIVTFDEPEGLVYITKSSAFVDGHDRTR